MLFEELFRKEVNTNLGVGLQEGSFQVRGSAGIASPAPWYRGVHLWNAMQAHLSS